MKKMLIMLLLTELAVGAAQAQAPDPDTTAIHFIIMASIANVQEISSGKLAAKMATRTDVRAFGQMMVTDHGRLQQKLLQLAKVRGYQVPAVVTETPVPDPNLANTSGDDFDRIYIHALVASHRSAVMMFRNYAVTGKDPEVKAFSGQTLPLLKEHLAAIKALDKKYKDLAAK